MYPSYRERPPRLVGGHPVLDLLNTVEWRGTDRPVERLTDASEVIAWSEASAVIDRAEADELDDAAKAEPAVAEAARRRLIGFREAARGVLLGNAEDAQAEVNRLFAAYPTIWRVAGGSVRPVPPEEPHALPLVRLIAALAAFLADPARPPVRACGDPRCGWVFADGSRRRNRLWCDMGGCGNRAKARRHAARRKGT
ncbi:CGNR zinc finger domain-containing protein [Elioraea rosea]|uniref:CGNR zinc finger domain-containing protein n=1 Tax=Elioraea rosea TaxID=2492390 RepID=UPI001315707D|nr:CGNR zinc finger domain-containing protein [Elioraea rosea]